MAKTIISLKYLSLLLMLSFSSEVKAGTYCQFGIDNYIESGNSNPRLSFKGSLWRLKGDYIAPAHLQGDNLTGYGIIFGGDMNVDPDILSLQFGKVLYSNSGSKKWFPLFGFVAGGSAGILLSNQIGGSVSIWSYLGLLSGVSFESRYLLKDGGSIRFSIFHRIGIPLDALLIH